MVLIGEVKEKLENLAKAIVDICNDDIVDLSLSRYIDKYTRILDLGIETISYMKKQEYEI